MANKIIIEMIGGVVQRVVSNFADIQVEILDHDDMNDCGVSLEDKNRANTLQKEMETMVVVY